MQGAPPSGKSQGFWNWIFGGQQQQQGAPREAPGAQHPDADSDPPSDSQDDSSSNNQSNPHPPDQNDHGDNGR
jgi:hypothetical protein